MVQIMSRVLFSSLLLLLLLLLTLSPLGCCSDGSEAGDRDDSIDPEHVKQSFLLCRSDEHCAYSFYIEYKQQQEQQTQDDDDKTAYTSSYDYKLFRLLYDIHLKQDDSVAVCAQQLWNDTYSANDREQALWLGYLRLARPCPENHMYISGYGCQCMNGKICEEQSGYSLYFSDHFLAVFVGFLTFVVVYNLISSTDSHRKTDDYVTAMEQHMLKHVGPPASLANALSNENKNNSTSSGGTTTSSSSNLQPLMDENLLSLRIYGGTDPNDYDLDL